MTEFLDSLEEALPEEEPEDNRSTIKLPGEAEIVLGANADDGYFPMDDYKGRDYEPFGGRDKHMCEVCVEYYQRLYDKGLTKSPFMPICCGDIRMEAEAISAEEYGVDYDYYKVLQDPVAWAKFEFDWTARWYQSEMLRCTSQFKAVRAGRRCGKTETLAITALWHAYTNGGLLRGNFEILIIAPFQAQVARIFDIMHRLIGDSKTLKIAGVIERRTLNPQLIKFQSGGVIRGFSSGAHSGSKSDKIRGQDAHMLLIDEVDYLADEDIEVIMAVLASHPECKLIVSSTPTGYRKKLHNWCTNKKLGFREFWYISAESPSWTPMVEDLFRSQYAESGYAREFLAEFGEPGDGVFRASDIHAAMGEYTYEDCLPHSEALYIIGVDWNKTTGTHILVLEAIQFKDGPFKYRLVHKTIIRKAEFTQHAAVAKIIELDKKWGGQSAYIYVDAGYGSVQVEMMHKIDVDQPHLRTRYAKRVVPITMNKNIEIKDPTNNKVITKQCKQFMVELASRAMEQQLILIPKDEDTTARIIENELAYANIGLIQQMRDFKIEKVSPTGVPRYSQGYEHTLTAWMLAIMGFTLEHSDIRKVNICTDIAYVANIGPDVAGQKITQINDLTPIKDPRTAGLKAKKHAASLRPTARGISMPGITKRNSSGPLARQTGTKRSRHWEEEIGSEIRRGNIHKGTRRGI